MEGAILITGATGYVGGRLAPLLLARGYKVRALVRSARKINGRPWANHENLEVIEGDLQNLDSVREAMQGCFAAYYLVHSMEQKNQNFSDMDRRAAYNMVRASRNSSLERIIYLSGLVPDDPNLSLHLRSRAEVAEILSLGDAKLTTLRAAQLIGAGSASFEMVRYLVDRLPVMVTPRWVRVKTQPISTANVLEYLIGVLEHPETAGETYDIGGPDVIEYRELFDIYAREAGLHKRLIIPVPFLSLGLSAHWVSLVTPVSGALAKPLIEGMRNEVVCKENRIREIIPQELFSVRASIARALGRVRNNAVPTSWFDAGNPIIPEWVMQGDPSYAGGTLLQDSYAITVRATPEEMWKPIARIGGETGWYSKDILWRLRGLMDKVIGGPGLQRGRRNPEEIYVGDALDFWRVVDVRQNERLLLLTEMRLPGEGTLDLWLSPENAEETTLSLSIYFRPKGLLGLAYWYAVMPLHKIAFVGMLRAMAANIGKQVTKSPHRIESPLADHGVHGKHDDQKK